MIDPRHLFRNAFEVARHGGLRTDDEPTPFDVVAESPVHRVRRYFPGTAATGRPVVLVPPLMLTADVYDVSPQCSAVRALREHGVDPFVVDFGVPCRASGGLRRTLAEHVVAVSDAIEVVRDLTGRDVHLAGYSQGGMFCYQAAAYRRGVGIASVTTFGSPVDVRDGGLLGLPAALSAKAAPWIVGNLLQGRSVPGWVTRSGFRMMDPVGSLRSRLAFVLALHDREALLPREGQRRYLTRDGWIAWPGPALADFMQEFMVHNRMLVGGFTIGDHAVTLADIGVPILAFVGENDEIAPPRSVRAIRRAAPLSKVHEVALPAGHFGLVVGRTAQDTTWPVVAASLAWHDGDGPQPTQARPLEGDVVAELVAA